MLQRAPLPLCFGGLPGGREGTATNLIGTLDLAIDELSHLALQCLLRRARGGFIYPSTLRPLTLIASVTR